MIVLPFIMIVLLGFGFLMERQKNQILRGRLERMKAMMIMGKRRT